MNVPMQYSQPILKCVSVTFMQQTEFDAAAADDDVKHFETALFE